VRLRLYARFVKHLEICKGNYYDYQIFNWKDLLEISQSNPLLPNITSLDLTNPRWCSKPDNIQLPLMLMFISPSLLEYGITFDLKQHIPAISKTRCTAILHALQKQCPKLGTLVLCSDNTSGCPDEERPLVPLDYDISNFFEAAPLRILTSSLSIINDMRHVSLLSRGIERLNIHYTLPCGSFEALTAPDVEWPNLYQLSVYSLRRIEDLNYLWAVPALVSKLTSVKLQLHDRSFPHNTISDSLEMLATALANGSPHLKRLWLFRRGTRGSFENPAAVVQLLSKLALQELRVGSRADETPGSVDLRRNLQGRKFQSIEHLEVGQHLVDLLDLQFYVRSMPELKHLAIQVRISNKDLQTYQVDMLTSLHDLNLHVVNAIFEDTSESAWESASRYVLPVTFTEYMLNRFRFLLSLWPNVLMFLGWRIKGEHAGWGRMLRTMQMRCRRDMHQKYRRSDTSIQT
jgi:hypothetical protein